jgi:tetratricopeptide (TPR) repeat protein
MILTSASRWVERALMLNPNLRHAWIASGAVRLHNGEPELAIAHFEYAMRLSPFDPFITGMWRGIALAHLLASRYDQSLSHRSTDCRIMSPI